MMERRTLWKKTVDLWLGKGLEISFTDTGTWWAPGRQTRTGSSMHLQRQDGGRPGESGKGKGNKTTQAVGVLR